MVQSISWQHAMALVGYGKLKEGDIIHRGTNLDPEPVPSAWIGKTYWIFKNSWGIDEGDNGYVYCVLNVYGGGGSCPYIDDTEPYITPLIESGTANLTRMCIDKDADGYYNWGIGNKPQECPQCPNEIDSDDNNSRIGYFDENYYGTPVAPKMQVTYEYDLTNPVIIEDDDFVTFTSTGNKEITITIKNDGDAQLNLQQVISSNPSVFNIAGITPFHVPMNGEDISFQIDYTHTNGINKDQAIITIPTLEPEFGDFEFVLANQDCGLTPTDIREITTTQSWETSGIIGGDVYIKYGGELTISGHYGFLPDVDIFVEQGGKLIIDGGVLTSSCSGFNEYTWNGIDVWGNSSSSQYGTSNQGYIKILNNGRIYNAEIAIEVAKVVNGQYVNGTTGGIVVGADAMFIDNNSDIVFYPFDNTNPAGEPALNLSLFKNVQFLNKSLTENPGPRVNLWGVNGIKFLGCSFIKEQVMYGANGIGINSFSSGFYVDNYCLNASNPCSASKQTYFENLQYGIYAYNGELSKYISIDTTIFKNNSTGIYMSWVDNQSVIRNQFIFDDTHDLTGEVAGLYLEYGTGYSIEENDFSSDVTDIDILGIQIFNSSSAYNEIYNNTFDNLLTGISAAGINRDEDGNGLCIKCNDFEDCVTDVYVYPGGMPSGSTIGIATDQGELGSTAPPGVDPNTMAAGNTFTATEFQDIYRNFDIHDDLDLVYYTHHPNLPEIKLRPIPINKVERVLDPSVQYLKEGSCPSNLGSGIDILEEKSTLSTEAIQITAYNDTLNQLVDGGDTESLNFDVQTSFPNEALQVRQELLDESPYLSDTVMKSAIDKENVLPNAMIRDVLVANPHSAKSATILEILDDRFDPMPEYMMAEIMGGLNVTGTIEILERKLVRHSSIRGKSLTKLLRYYKNDTINAWASDSLIALLQNEQNPVARYQLAFLYLDIEDSLSVVNTLNNIPDEFTLDDNQQTLHDLYDDLFNVLLEAQSDTTGLDSLDFQSLQNIAINQNCLPGICARNILMTNGLINYQEQLYFPDYLKSSPVWENIKPLAEIKDNLLKVFPNPTDSYFIIEYDLNETEGNGTIIISDLTGKQVLRFTVKDKKNQRVIATNRYPAGMYIVQLLVVGELKESCKINIIK